MIENMMKHQDNSLEKYPLIGEGLEYFVYDIGNDRILKTAKNYEQKIEMLKKWGVTSQPKREEQIKYLDDAGNKSTEGIKELIKNNKLDPNIIGNPIFDDSKYTQDKVLTLDKYFLNHQIEENKVVIDEYINLIHKFWSSGCSDRVFNFSVNNGLNKNNELAQIDFGEFTFGKNEVREFIENKVWFERYSYSRIEDKELKDYITNRFNEEFTIEKLNQLWPKGEN